MKSPCIDVCQLDAELGVCIGCCRTLDEIARWSDMDDAERERILAALAERKLRLNVPKVPMPPPA
jgi:uncharacterized protein